MNRPRYIIDQNFTFRFYLDRIGKEFVECHPFFGKVYLDILSEIKNPGSYDLVKVRAFFVDGSIRVGYVYACAISIAGKELLFDGRFNSLEDET